MIGLGCLKVLRKRLCRMDMLIALLAITLKYCDSTSFLRETDGNWSRAESVRALLIKVQKILKKASSPKTGVLSKLYSRFKGASHGAVTPIVTSVIRYVLNNTSCSTSNWNARAASDIKTACH